ncbi:MAG: hypothetical protein K6U75_12520 [Firmicutes bacterium]|nr:hypothetical protein [Bacillota bacterium]
MESIMGGRGGIVSSITNERQQRHLVATLTLFRDLQRESAERALFTLAALEFYEEKLLRTLRQGSPNTLKDAVVGY